jgi:hypothetical protein
MNDLDLTVVDVLDRHHSRSLREPDWDNVLDRAKVRRRRHRLRLPVVVAALLVAVLVPALAFSASVREFLGFPQPILTRARLMVSAPLGSGRTIRLWEAPSDEGGVCSFVTLNAADTDTRPAQGVAGGCTQGRDARLHSDKLPIQVGASNGGSNVPIIDGWVSPNLHAASVELRWRTGKNKLEYSNHYFVGASPAMSDPPFPVLPFHVVVLDANGQEVGRLKLPTGWLYTDWKHTLPRLRAYVRQHPGRHAM